MKSSLIPYSNQKQNTSLVPYGDKAVAKAERPDTLIGNYINSDQQFGFSRKERENHTHVIGTTGTGKSKFLEALIRQDIENEDCGLCLIDPHGKLYHDLMSYMSTEASRFSDRVIFFDPFNDLNHVMGFNPLPLDKTRIDAIEKSFVSACLKAWGQDDIHETPRIARWLQIIAHTLLVNDLTLLESAPLISTEKHNPFRSRMMQNVINETVRVEWDQLEQGALGKRTEMLEGAGNRLISFLQNEIIRLIIGMQKNVLDLGKIMNEGKVVLINLNCENGKVTRPDAKLIGTMIISELHRQSLLRDPNDPDLKPFYVYIDEFAQYVTREIAEGLEEARKFKVAYTLSHQHLSQLRRDDSYLFSSVLTDCKNKVVFGGLSEDDVDLMTREIQTGFLDLKSIKHTQYQTRIRQIESVRKVRQKQYSRATGVANQKSQTDTNSSSDTKSSTIGENHAATKTLSEQHGVTISESDTNSEGGSDAVSQGEGKSHTDGTSENLSQAISKGQGNSTALSFGRSHSEGGGHTDNNSHTRTDGGSRALGYTRTDTNAQTQGDTWSNSDMTGSSQASGQNEQWGDSTAEGKNYSPYSDYRSYNDSSQRSRMQGSSSVMGDMQSSTSSQGGQRSQSQSQALGQSQTDTDSWSDAYMRGSANSINYQDTRSSGEQFGKSQFESETNTKGTGRNQADTHSTQFSKTHTDNYSQSKMQGRSETETHGTATSEQIGRSKQEGRAHTEGNSHADGRSRTDSLTETSGYSEGYIPFLEPHEVQEITGIQFWSKEDLMYMKKAEMKNLQTAQVFVQIQGQAPVRGQVMHIQDSDLPHYLRVEFEQDFRAEISEMNPGSYLSLPEAKEQIEIRQLETFGDTIHFFDTLLPNKTAEDDNYLIEDDPDYGQIYGD